MARAMRVSLEHWLPLGTTNPIEPIFADVRFVDGQIVVLRVLA